MAVGALPLSTTHKTPAGYKNLGIVTGIEIRSSNFIQSILAGFADFFGTEAGKDWTGMKKLLVETRDTAVDDTRRARGGASSGRSTASRTTSLTRSATSSSRVFDATSKSGAGTVTIS